MALKKLLKSILNVNCIKIINAEFDHVSSSLYIRVEITKGQRSRCPVCGRKCNGYDSTTEYRSWRALDFGACRVYILSHVNRVQCPVHGIHTEQVPWAHHHSGFTREFEQQVAYLALHLNRTEVSKLMRINWRTVGMILSRTKDHLEPDSSIRFKDLKRIGIDETSYRKGHKYVTVVVDYDTNQVIWVGKGTGKEVLSSFFALLTQEQRESIELTSTDGSRAVLKNGFQTVKDVLMDFTWFNGRSTAWMNCEKKYGVKPGRKRKTSQSEKEDVPEREKKPRQQQNMGRAINMHLARILRI